MHLVHSQQNHCKFLLQLFFRTWSNPNPSNVCLLSALKDRKKVNKGNVMWEPCSTYVEECVGQSHRWDFNTEQSKQWGQKGIPGEKQDNWKSLSGAWGGKWRLVCESGDVHAWELLEHPYLWQASATAKHQCSDLLPPKVTWAGCGTETSTGLLKHRIRYLLCFCAFLNSRELVLYTRHERAGWPPKLVSQHAITPPVPPPKIWSTTV